MARPPRKGGLEDIATMSNLLYVLSPSGRPQFRVCSDVRVRLTLGLQGHQLNTDLVQARQAPSITIRDSIFMVSGSRSAARHDD
jgi:hypothetical protein